ncbi:MAG: hypothetical protein ABIP78_00385 [Pyrinomonadaceae bacterium]
MNGLYYGDNLNIRRWYGGNPRGSKGAQDCTPSNSRTLLTGRVSASSGPPFNWNRNFNALFKDESGLEADSREWLSADTWHWKGTVSSFQTNSRSTPINPPRPLPFII